MSRIAYPSPIDLTRYRRDSPNSVAMYGLPLDVTFCKSCVISNQRPNSAVEYDHTSGSKKTTINFEDGVCDACRFTDRKKNLIDWAERDEKLRDLCNKHRKNDGSYDCIVPGSGGKDSFLHRTYSKRVTGCTRLQLHGILIFTQSGVGETSSHGLVLDTTIT